MYATWVQNHPPNKSYSYSWILSDFLGCFPDFLGRNKNYVGHNLKNVPSNRTNNVLFHPNYTLFLLKKAQITRKRAQYLKRGLKISIFKPSENRPIPSNFFWIRIWVLNGEARIVKISILQWQRVRNIHCYFLPKSIISFVNGDNLIVEQFVFVCFWYSGQRREQTSNKMSARK